MTPTHINKYIVCIQKYRHLMHLTFIEYMHTQCVNRNTHIHPDHTVYSHELVDGNQNAGFNLHVVALIPIQTNMQTLFHFAL